MGADVDAAEGAATDVAGNEAADAGAGATSAAAAAVAAARLWQRRL